MEDRSNKEKVIEDLKEKMSDENFELDVDVLETAAGGAQHTVRLENGQDFTYFDTYDD